MVKAAVAEAQKNNLKIISLCPYAKKVIEKTPEFKDLLVEQILRLKNAVTLSLSKSF